MKLIFLNILERLGWAFIIWTVMSSEPIEIIRFGITDNINYLYDISSSNIIKIEGIFNSFSNIIESEVISFFGKV